MQNQNFPIFLIIVCCQQMQVLQKISVVKIFRLETLLPYCPHPHFGCYINSVIVTFRNYRNEMFFRKNKDFNTA